MPHINLGLWVFCIIVFLALLTGRQRVTKVAAALALLAGIGIGTSTSWGPQVWPVINDLIVRAS